MYKWISFLQLYINLMFLLIIDFPHSSSQRGISNDLYWCLFGARLYLQNTYSAVGDIDEQKGTYDSSSECSDCAEHSVRDHKEDTGKSAAWVTDRQPRHDNARSGSWWMCRERHTEKMRNSRVSGKTEGKRKFRIFKDLKVNQDMQNSAVSA